jgi:hypothetical protein
MIGLATRTVSVMALCLAAAPVLAQSAPSRPGPVYKDSERFAEPGYDPNAGYAPGPAHRLLPLYGPQARYSELPTVVTGPLRPHRRLMGDETYAGSEYGLGKPSYAGIGTRPDWGRSSQ